MSRSIHFVLLEVVATSVKMNPLLHSSQSKAEIEIILQTSVQVSPSTWKQKLDMFFSLEAFWGHQVFQYLLVQHWSHLLKSIFPCHSPIRKGRFRWENNPSSLVLHPFICLKEASNQTTRSHWFIRGISLSCDTHYKCMGDLRSRLRSVVTLNMQHFRVFWSWKNYEVVLIGNVASKNLKPDLKAACDS